ncbi:MAG TPA: hypothetical protein VF159_03390 [Gemmatimonadaceae bacterium]
MPRFPLAGVRRFRSVACLGALFALGPLAPRLSGQSVDTLSTSPFANADPYSRVTLRVGATAGTPTNQLRNYYHGGAGPVVELEMPFEFGNLGFTANAITYRGQQPQYYDIKANVLALDWRSRFLGSGPVRARVGLRLGDMHMRYGGPNPTGLLLASEEMLGGPTADVTLHLFGPMTASLGAAWLYSPSASRAHVAYGTAALSYTHGVPDWLRHFLE